MRRILPAALAVLFLACADKPVDSDDLTAAEEQVDDGDDLSRPVPNGTILQATTNVNLRVGPSTKNRVILVIPNGARSRVVDGTPSHGWFKVDYAGHTGWSYGYYHRVYSTPGGGGGGSSGDWIVQRAKGSIGFSYHWGHGAWASGSSHPGSCHGLCPNCSHSGSYGADCSGMVAKAMKVPSSNSETSRDWHPYSTWNFFNERREWSPVRRGSVYEDPGDAFVWHGGGEGHTFIYERGDAWGSLLAIECRGCSYGCVRGYRTAFSGYKVVRRHGLSGTEKLDDETDASLASAP